MRKFKKLRKENQVGLLKYEQKACKKIINVIQQQGWNVGENDVYLDPDWGWVILADRKTKEDGLIIRRIKPFQLDNNLSKEKANLLQEKLRKDLVEVYPYFLKADKNRNLNIELLRPTFSLS